MGIQEDLTWTDVIEIDGEEVDLYHANELEVELTPVFYGNRLARIQIVFESLHGYSNPIAFSRPVVESLIVGFQELLEVIDMNEAIKEKE